LQVRFYKNHKESEESGSDLIIDIECFLEYALYELMPEEIVYDSWSGGIEIAGDVLATVML